MSWHKFKIVFGVVSLMGLGFYVWIDRALYLRLSAEQLNGPMVCEVHHVALQRDFVPIHYGFGPTPTFEYHDALQKGFPHSATEVNGGCVGDSQILAEVLYCQRCRTAAQQWENENPQGKYVSKADLRKAEESKNSDWVNRTPLTWGNTVSSSEAVDSRGLVTNDPSMTPPPEPTTVP